MTTVHWFALFVSLAVCAHSFDLLDPILELARARAPVAAAAGLCSDDDGLNVFISRTAQGSSETTLSALEFSSIEAVFFNHPTARVFVLVLSSVDVGIFEDFLAEGYCAVEVQLKMSWLQDAIHAAHSSLSRSQLALFSSDVKLFSFFINSGLLALQVLYGGILVPMDGILLNPFDTLLPAALSLNNTAILLERVTITVPDPTGDFLQSEDFERSWMPRSHTDRGDGKTRVCMHPMCPRAFPRGCPFGRKLLNTWLESFKWTGVAPSADVDATRLYSIYVRERPHGQTQLEQGEYAVVTLPGWVVVEPHFPDGWRYYGNRGATVEAEDRAQFHSQLFSPRFQRESSDWSLVRAFKVWLPLGYGPEAARNILPRSVVDMTVRFVSLGIAGKNQALVFQNTLDEAGKMLLAGSGEGEINPGATESPQWHRWHTPADAYEALEVSMADSLGVGTLFNSSREVALPGLVGGFRTFRDLRVVGRGSCQAAGMVSSVEVALTVDRPGVVFFCRNSVRPEVPTINHTDLRTCEDAIGAKKDSIRVSGLPAKVNSILSLLAYRPLVPSGGTLEDADIATHFVNITLDLRRDACRHPSGTTMSPQPTTRHGVKLAIQALVDDVQEQVTVVAHSAARCDLLERLAQSFRDVYERLRIIATCECQPEVRGETARKCEQLTTRKHESIKHFTMIDVPFDFGLANGKSLLARMVQTEFLLVLDDDFTRSPLSCLECMLLRMRSSIHSTAPFDMIGFPVLEDERNFGAFRGRILATPWRLFLEPIVSDPAADGCVKVDIHPMAFLARTARFRLFTFESQLRVGEHEHFFYANRYFGLHAAVCFDSTFTHFRPELSSEYSKRRGRMNQLMSSQFEKIGFQSMMYLFRKYDSQSSVDQNSLLLKGVPPWSVPDDTCGPQSRPPADMSVIFAAIFSTSGIAGAQFRQLLRGGSHHAWLPRLAAVVSTRWAFFVEEQADPPPRLAQEEDEYSDVVFMPHADYQGKGVAASHMLFVLTYLRVFQFRWLLVSEENAFIHVEPLVSKLTTQEVPEHVVVGGWRKSDNSKAKHANQVDWLPAEFFAMSFDTKHLLASPRISRWLRTDLDGGCGAAALNAWLSPLQLKRLRLPGVHVEAGGASEICSVSSPSSIPTSVVHPVTPDDLVMLSGNAVAHGTPCGGSGNSGLFSS